MGFNDTQDNFDELDIPDDVIYDDSKVESNENEEYTQYQDNNEQVIVETQNKPERETKKDKKDKKLKTDKEIKPDNCTEEPKKKDDCALYIITDKPSIGLIDYMRSCGLNVTNIYDNITDVRNLLLMQFGIARIAIIDSGTGKFVTPTIRKELIDMIGANDNDTRFTVFYTDSIIKSDANSELGKSAKGIEWIKYQSTSIFVAAMLCHNENYIIDTGNAYKESKASNILDYVGQSPKDCELEKLGPLSITAASIAKNVLDESTGCIRKFQPRL